MKGKQIKLRLFVISAIALIGGFSLAGCKEKDVAPVALENFDDIEASAVLGAEYTLPEANAIDVSGNEYSVAYKVQTASGRDVAVLKNTFSVTELEDYLITCRVNVGEEVYTRTITVKVTDKGAPEIIFEDYKNGMVGVKYFLPEVCVYDDSQELLSPAVKLYTLSGEEKGEEIEIVEGGFIPTESGEYLVEATATDSSGNTATETAIVYVREKIRANEVLSFDDETDIDNVGSLGATVSYLEEYEDETGVAKFSYTGGYWANQFTFLPLCDVSESSDIYTKYDSFVVRMYIVQSDEAKNAFTNIAVKDYATNSKYFSSTKVEYNKWVDYKFDVECLSAFYGDTLDTAFGGKIWGYGNEALKGTDDEELGAFYVAEMYMEKELAVSIDGEATVGSTVTIDVAPAAAETVITVQTPSGATVASTGTYTITEPGLHNVTVLGDGYYGATSFTATRVYTQQTTAWNGYTLTTYGASAIDANGGITLYTGSYDGASPVAMGTSDVPYVAFNGEYSVGKTVVVDFTGCNMPNIAFFADQPNENTKNFVGAKGLMFSQTVLNKNGEVHDNTSYANKLNVYGPVLFTKYNDATKTQSIYQNLTHTIGDTSYAGVQTDVFMDYKAMQADTTTKYRLLVRFNAGDYISWSAVLMAWDEAGSSYKIVYKGEKTTKQTYAAHSLTSGSIIIYGRPYAETKIDKLHTLYDSTNDVTNVKTWTGVDVSF